MVLIMLWRPLEEIQERSLENHTWPPVLDPPGSRMHVAGVIVAPSDHSPEHCSWSHKTPVDITAVLRDFGVHTEPCDLSPR